MKRICLNCGERVFPSRKKFCSNQCSSAFHSKPKPFTIRDEFEYFQNIVAAAQNADEFRSLYRQYFMGGNS